MEVFFLFFGGGGGGGKGVTPYIPGHYVHALDNKQIFFKKR